MAGRPLTAGEIALANKLFNKSIKYTDVKVHNNKYFFMQPAFSGMTPNGEIYVADIYRDDYASANASLRAFFIHEMVHVWQYQLKILNPITAAISESVKHLFDYSKAYNYELKPGMDILDFSIEQQAAIIEDYYRINLANIKPYPGRIKNDIAKVKSDKLFEKVLAKFLANPKYAQHTIVCKRSRTGHPSSRRMICRRVLVNE